MNMMLDSFCYLLFIVIAMKAYSHRLVADIFVDHSPFILLPIDAIGGPANLFHVLKANTTESSFKFILRFVIPLSKLSKILEIPLEF